MNDGHYEQPFVKMHGLLNDYIYIDGFRDDGHPALRGDATAQAMLTQPTVTCESLPSLHDQDPTAFVLTQIALKYSRRDGGGIGADGVIWVGPAPPDTGAAGAMRMFNADGSESEMCGNGLRCAARLASGHLGRHEFTILTRAGLMHVACSKSCSDVTVHLPTPKVSDIEELEIVYAEEMLRVRGVSVNMGNPHFVLFVELQDEKVRLTLGSPDSYAHWTDAVAQLGRAIEHHERFRPHRTNVEFITQSTNKRGHPSEERERLLQWTWERGSGETMACGTGACASAAAAMHHSIVSGREVTMVLRGGEINIHWPSEASELQMEASTTVVFHGTLVVCASWGCE
jgi:diaminopimelate epimerase